jgi:hypothetical protein
MGLEAAEGGEAAEEIGGEGNFFFYSYSANLGGELEVENAKLKMQNLELCIFNSVFCIPS